MRKFTITLFIGAFAVMVMATVSPSAFAAGVMVHSQPGTSSPGCENTNTCFMPYQASIPVGATIVFMNIDNVSHTFTSGTQQTGYNGLFDSGLVSPDSSFFQSFDEGGEYQYFCTLHPWMAGVVIVEAVAQEEHSLVTHENETEKTSVAEHTEDNSSHETESSMDEMQDQLESEHIDDTPEDIHKHTSITAEIAQWIGVGTLLVAVPVFAIRMRSANKLGYKCVVLTLALGVGIMHVLLAPDHLTELGIEHGIFFGILGSAQIGFGLLFVTKPTQSLAIIGIVGTIGSLVLYFITRMGELKSLGFPEGMDQVGIIAKMIEISMIVILTYLLVYLSKQMPVGITKDIKNN